MIEAEEKETKAKQKTADVNRRLEQALSALQELGQENQNIQVPGIENIPKTTNSCLLYTSPSPRDQRGSRMPSSA